MTKRNDAFKFPGIYKITNTLTNAVYIGQAVVIKHRWYNHDRSLKKGDHRNCYLQRAYNKYGKEAFVKTVEVNLQHLMNKISDKELKTILDVEEVRVLHEHEGHKCYNLMRAGYSGVIASEHTRKLLGSKTKKRWESPEYRSRLTKAHQLIHQDPEFSARRAASISAAKSTPEATKKVSDRFTALWGDKTYKKETSEAIRAGWSNPQVLKDQSNRVSNSWKDPEVKARRVKGLKAAWARRKAQK